MRSAMLTAAAVLLATTAACGGDQSSDAETREATLESLPGWSEAYPDAVGSATVATDEGSDFEVALSGLEPLTEYTAHLHSGTCDDQPPGGGHWLADPDGEDVASNWIHLTFDSSVEGAGEGSAESDHSADDRALSVVVHAEIDDADQARRLPSDRVLCGDLGH